MGTMFFIILILSEAALAALTFSKFKEKASWLKNRTLTTAAETAVLLLIIFLPTTALKWRFAAAAFLLIIRLLFEAARWAVCRKKAQGEKGKAAAAASGVLSAVFIGLALVPSFVFANYSGLENTGSYEVKTCSAILVDESRTDPFEDDGSPREVPAHFFYPDGDGSYPLVLFSHGAFGYYQSNYSTFTELASHGYVVVSLDHPHHAFFTTDTSGSTIIVDSGFINEVMTIGNSDLTDTDADEVFAATRDWVTLRRDDVNFVLDTIKSAKDSGTLGDAWHTDNESETAAVISLTDTSKIGVMGHSLGGAAAVAVGRERDDIGAVVVLDGTMLSERVALEDGKYQYIDEPYPVPVLDFSKRSDYNDIKQYEEVYGYPYVNEYVMEHAKDGKKVWVSDTGHMDFTDLPLISPVIAEKLGKGSVDSREFMPRLNGYVLNWFDYYLKGEGAPDIPENC